MSVMPPPVDALLGQLHEVSKRRTYAYAAAEENMREAGKHWADVWELDSHEEGLLTALQALGVSIELNEEGEAA